MDTIINRNQKKPKRKRLKKSKENQKLYKDDNIPWNKKTLMVNTFTLKIKPSIRSLKNDIIK